MKTETKMMKVVKDYGDIMREFGVTDPVFLMNHDCVMAVMNPVGLEFYEKNRVPRHLLPQEMMKVPVAVGMCDGVLMVEVIDNPARSEVSPLGRLEMIAENQNALGNHTTALAIMEAVSELQGSAQSCPEPEVRMETGHECSFCADGKRAVGRAIPNADNTEHTYHWFDKCPACERKL